ncbi:cytochrome b/b6 domain-containing protein [Parahaliea mediterranea]|uniref:cytochrome b/b6 domain-containing protein n=1 Tax=Parahaliea mediterranea TaxID=651086 RepID=UPI000E2E9EAE|nr:cytochrome b/b6 domain-containing protein [Parahaliea mediterranea]
MASAEPPLGPSQWSAAGKLLHWLFAALILAAIVLALVAGEMPLSPTKLRVYIWHKSLGITVLALLLARVVWRLRATAPPQPAGLSSLNVRLAGAGHFALYVLMLLIPLSGWVLNSTADFPFRWFGMFAVPSLTGPDRDLQHAFESVHGTLAWLLIVLLMGHVAMAIGHHLRSRDFLQRMAPTSGYGRGALAIALAGALGVGVYAWRLPGQQSPAGEAPSSAMAGGDAIQAAEAKEAPEAVSAARSLSLPLSKAPQWPMVATESHLGFTATYDNVAFQGHFPSFKADIRFDPQNLPGSRFDAAIPLAGVTTGSDERDMSLPGADWFHVDEYPNARYTAARFSAGGDGSFVAHGTLNLKGVERAVALQFTWREDGDNARLSGQAVLDRRQFNVGSGMWANDSTVGFEVIVQVDLQLRAP